MISHILKTANFIRRCGHRHIFVLAGERDWGIHALKNILANLPYRRKVVFTWKKDFSLDCEVEELKNSGRHMGKTYDFIALDFHHSLVPNDLGKLVGTVRGGGIIVILVPELEKWKRSINYFHESILTPPYSLEDVRHNFVPWLIEKMMTHEGVSIYEKGRWIKKSEVRCSENPRSVSDGNLPENLRHVALTQDQANVVGKLIYGGWKTAVLTANRGRGKSSALGMVAAHLIFSRKAGRIGVTAPELGNLEEFFRILKMLLDRWGVKYREYGKSLEGKGFVVEYHPPTSVVPKKYQLLMVDEAAGIPVPLLLEFSRARRVIYSTTVHGYEGTGRAFSIRFREELLRREKRVVELEMNEPIRYASNDPVERWLFDALLLNSEPADIEEVNLKKLEYRRYTMEELLKDERKLREYYGIFVLAHYRNNPNDFGILCDAPNQEIRTLEYEGHVVCSVQLAREGNIGDYAEELYYGMVPPGNIVPDVVVKHYRDMEFLNMRGLRIVRIATHPKFMGLGIGSKMLQHLSGEDVQWLGASFGATPQLLRFWVENGFYPIHVSPRMNEKTGEYSVTVLKMRSGDIEEKRRAFGRRFLATLGEIHSTMHPELARQILRAIPKRGKIKLGDVQWKRLIAYAWGPGNYEVTMDVIYDVAWQYFTAKKVPSLNAEQERILISKVLQHRSWKDTGRVVGRGDMYVVIELREMMRKFVRGKFDDEVSEFQRRFHGEDKEKN